MRLLATLLLALSASTCESVATTTMVPQHRVKRPQRHVEYESKARRFGLQRFWVPDSESPERSSQYKPQKKSRLRSERTESNVSPAHQQAEFQDEAEKDRSGCGGVACVRQHNVVVADEESNETHWHLRVDGSHPDTKAALHRWETRGNTNRNTVVGGNELYMERLETETDQTDSRRNDQHPQRQSDRRHEGQHNDERRKGRRRTKFEGGFNRNSAIGGSDGTDDTNGYSSSNGGAADIQEEYGDVYNATNVTATVEFGTSVDSSSNQTKRSNETSSTVFTGADNTGGSGGGNGTSNNNGNNEHGTQSTNEQNLYRPMRILAILSDQANGGQFLNDRQRSMLLEEIVAPATLAWSSALRVLPVQGNLTVDRGQLYDGLSCGPGLDSGFPSVVVPESHFEEGINGTDFVVYLSLAFVPPETDNSLAQNSTDSSNETDTGDDPQSTQPWTSTDRIFTDDPTERYSIFDQYLPNANSSDTDEGTNETTHEYSNSMSQGFRQNSSRLHGSFRDAAYPQAQAGTNNSDVDVDSDADADADPDDGDLHNNNGKGTDEEIPTCTGEFLAASTYCSTDQHDRPTAALLHICIGKDFFRFQSLDENIVTVMHELGHSLGFNLQSMAHFRDEEGRPLTPRGPDGNIIEQQVECTGPAEQRGSATIPLPSEDVIRFRTVRGGVRVAQVVTPSVRQVVRNHFDCQELDGAELENGDIFLTSDTDDTETPSSWCIGDHWERRLFRTDLMNPIITEVPFVLRISPITLALFADSGWYQVDISRTSFAAGWGRAAGCNFVDEPCVGEGGRITARNRPFFCADTVQPEAKGTIEQIQGCSPDLSSKAVCSMDQYDIALPGEYQYFGSTLGSNVGGSEPYLDFCPVYQGFDNGNCKIAGNEAFLRISSNEDFGSRNSRCVTGRFGNQQTAFCMQIACVLEDQILYVRVDRRWHRCYSAGQVIQFTSNGWSGSIACPDPIRTCPTFYCNRDCLGNGGRCNYETGRCVCATEGTTDTAVQTTRHGNNVPDTTSWSSSPVASDKICGNVTEDTIIELDDSPLTDYYVPSVDHLDGYNHGRHGILFWSAISVVSSAILLFIALLISSRRRIHQLGRFCRFLTTYEVDDDADGIIMEGDAARAPVAPVESPTETVAVAPAAAPTHNRSNKDKFVATLLFHMRVNDPRNDNAEIESTAFETESSGHFPSLSSDFESTVSEMEGSMHSFASDEDDNTRGPPGQQQQHQSLSPSRRERSREEWDDPLFPTPSIRQRTRAADAK